MKPDILDKISVGVVGDTAGRDHRLRFGFNICVHENVFRAMSGHFAVTLAATKPDIFDKRRWFRRLDSLVRPNQRPRFTGYFLQDIWTFSSHVCDIKPDIFDEVETFLSFL